VNLAFEQAVYADTAKEPRSFKNPQGVACNDSGTVVIADSGNQRLMRYTLSEGRLAGGTELKLPQLVYPVSVQLDTKGNALVLDGKTRKIVRVDAKGTFQGNVEIRNAGAGNVVPGSFAIDAADNLAILDIAARRVLVTDANGVVKRQIELPKTGLFTAVALDATDTVYAVDGVGAAVWSADKGSAAFKPLTKSMKDRMNFPTHAIVKKGKIYLVDQNGNGVVVLGIDGAFQGRQLSIGWGDGFVYYPSQLCMTDAGQVFVADRANNRVQLFNVVK
jgi:sugar lactone lactonase YvrE